MSTAIMALCGCAVVTVICSELHMDQQVTVICSRLHLICVTLKT